LAQSGDSEASECLDAAVDILQEPEDNEIAVGFLLDKSKIEGHRLS
jgi:hypothetical protein